jgi:hypothetical protein
MENSMSPKDKDIIAKKIHHAQVTKKILSTWDLLKEKDFHLNSDFLVIQKQEFRDLITEIIKEVTQSEKPKA